MNKIVRMIWFKHLIFNNLKNIKAVSLSELIISMLIVGSMVLSFYSLETYSHKQVVSADRRAKVQNSLTLSLEHMSKYVQQGTGNINFPAIKLYPASATKTGFQVRVDLNDPQTPDDLSDDAIVYYTLSGNTLSVGCTGTCGSVVAEDLSNKIVANFNNSVMPAAPTDGFYVSVDALGNSVDIGLLGRYTPGETPTAETKLSNPQVAMKTKLITNNSSTN
ncbi:MAG TPA: hypothetical protein PL125_04510 [Candidatus Omnitrophota bacterium]|nr:hypothetical protein [Candidatus Omnitrophota bacterium]HPT39441.1 hypothetical protein [Candidatus Omnitrophota bacterium]